ncbi:MAG: glycoside hydrolase family 127 protein [Kiritimatiellae bacterium]|nr:glycoside hydrolase family 127 protein [Kiritimatiellia bacterium]
MSLKAAATALFVACACIAPACRGVSAGVAVGQNEDKMAPLPPGAVKLSGGLAAPVAKSIARWHKGNVPYHEFAGFFSKGRPKFALGEMWGKFVRSGAMQYRHSPDPELKAILESAVKDILATERSNGSVSCVPVERQPAGGDGVTKPDCGDLWERKYVMLGMEDYYEWVERDPAVLASLERQAKCIMEQVGPAPKMDVRDAGWSANHVESSTLLEPFMRLWRLAGDAQCLDFARYLVECGGAKGSDLVQMAHDMVPPHLMGGAYPKAYETTSYFEGLAEYFRATGDVRVGRAVRNYFDLVLERELTIVGNGGGDQPYHPKVMGEAWDNTAAEQTNPDMKRMMETCTGVTWMKYASQVLRLTGDARAADAIERYVYNGLLGAMKPEGDGFSYVNLLNGEKVTNKGWGWKFPSGPVTCCNLNGPMGLAYIPFVAVMQTEKGPAVNLYNAGTSVARTASGGEVRLVAAGDLLDDGGWRVTVEPEREEAFAVSLRIPAWSENTAVSVNGTSVGDVAPGRYLELSRKWRKGDVVAVSFGFRARRLMAPHGANRAGDGFQAVVWGPIVLARDENTDAAYSEPVAVKADADGLVAVRRVAPAFPGHRLEFRVPTETGEITMCDYASVNGWHGKRIQTWLPLKP